jgi:hypothetical protein
VFAVFPKRSFLCYDSNPNEHLAVKVVPVVTSYRESQQVLAPGNLDLDDYLDTGPPNCQI